MTSDPVLANLADRAAKAAAEADRAASALRDYLLGGTVSKPESDWIELKFAEIYFGKSPSAVRRWAVNEGLGEFINGKWYLQVSQVLKYKSVRIVTSHFDKVILKPSALS